VELAIVLVIIGLIVGGILVGVDLIKTAGLNSTVSQIGSFNTAVHVFQDKYGALPGDISPSDASKFGFYYVTGVNAGATSFGDGNGTIQGQTGIYADGGTFEHEVAMFFLHLSQAHLVNGMFGAGGTVTVSGATMTGGSSNNPILSGIATGSALDHVIPGEDGRRKLHYGRLRERIELFCNSRDMENRYQRERIRNE
jgi:hypothetical protein